MKLGPLQQRLIRELQASAGKTATLVVLFAVGLYFWVPPLVRAFSGNSTPAPASAAANTAAPTTPSSADPATVTISAAATSASTKSSNDPETLAKRLQQCPLLRPASVDDLPVRPFTIDRDQFPLPVLFAEEIVEQSVVEEPLPKPVEQLDGLHLKSTILGKSRRAALINNRLFQEGQLVPWRDKQLRLSSVQRKSVTLTDGVTEWQLSLPDMLGDKSSGAETPSSETP